MFLIHSTLTPTLTPSHVKWSKSPIKSTHTLNLAQGKVLVIMSAKLSFVAISINDILFISISSRTKLYLILICLVLVWNVFWFLAKCIALWLSEYTHTTHTKLNLRNTSHMRPFNYFACLNDFVAMYSAPVVDIVVTRGVKKNPVCKTWSG